MTMNNGESVIIDIMENWSFLLSYMGDFLVSILIIIMVLVFYSRIRHQGLIFILVAEILSLGWLIFNFILIIFIFPASSGLSHVGFIELLNLISLFLRVLWGLLFIWGLSKLVQDLTFQNTARSL